MDPNYLPDWLFDRRPEDFPSLEAIDYYFDPNSIREMFPGQNITPDEITTARENTVREFCEYQL